jgi:hypothetical protein
VGKTRATKQYLIAGSIVFSHVGFLTLSCGSLTLDAVLSIQKAYSGSVSLRVIVAAVIKVGDLRSVVLAKQPACFYLIDFAEAVVGHDHRPIADGVIAATPVPLPVADDVAWCCHDFNFSPFSSPT